MSCFHCRSNICGGLGKGDRRDTSRARRCPCRRQREPQAGRAPAQVASGQQRTEPSRHLTPHGGATAGEPGLTPTPHHEGECSISNSDFTRGQKVRAGRREMQIKGCRYQSLSTRTPDIISGDTSVVSPQRRDSSSLASFFGTAVTD